MSCPIPGVLPLIESLGDNCELGFYLRENANESGSLLRWAITPLEQLISYIECNTSGAEFEFDQLVPSSPGMVRDTVTGFCFHTAMRSEQRSGSFEFESDEPTRKNLYATEKAKYDFLHERFQASLTSKENRIFFVKANNDLPRDGINRLCNAIAQRKGVDNFVLVAIYSTGVKAYDADLLWESENLCIAQINRFAPYSQAFDVDFAAWDRLFQKLADAPRIQQFLSVQKQSDSESRLTFGQVNWEPEAELTAKIELAFRIAKSLDTSAEFTEFVSFLARHDKSFHDQIGGDIHTAVVSGDSTKAVDRLDERYLSLIQLYSNFDLSSALDFHVAAEELYKSSGNSIVRYARLTNSLTKTKDLLDNMSNRGLKTVDIYPKYDHSFGTEAIDLTEASAYFNNGDNTKASRIELRLPKPRARVFSQTSSLDDLQLSESMWINNTRTNSVDHLTFYTLPEMRICHQPTGISFEEDAERRFVHSMSDMYHYFRVAGKATFGSSEKRLEQAYVLPRYGMNNYYHSLVDKLPGLYGYKVLNLDCPILSTYELDDAERHFAEVIGIDPDNIMVDMKGEISARNGILPNIGGLRPLFFDFLSDMPKGPSPVGRQVYITRERSTDRVMNNESTVHKIVQQHGFDVVAMEEFTLDDQMAIASNADTIVSPHGAGLANMVFAKKDTKIIELIPDRYMTPLFKQLSIDCGHRYSVVIGEVEKDGANANSELRWDANLDKLESVLSSLAA